MLVVGLLGSSEQILVCSFVCSHAWSQSFVLINAPTATAPPTMPVLLRAWSLCM